MNKKLILSLALLCVAFNGFAMDDKTEIVRNVSGVPLDQKTEKRLKYGTTSVRYLQLPYRIQNLFGDGDVFSRVNFGSSYFDLNGTVFTFAVKSNEYICFDQYGKWIVDPMNSRLGRHIPLQLDLRSEHSTTVPPLLCKDYFLALNNQRVSNQRGQVSVTRELSNNKSKIDQFIFEDPTDIVLECTPPCYGDGLVWAITSNFPTDIEQGSSNDQKFDQRVMKYVEKNKHVCLFKINNKKLELLRDLGNYPYCVGCYVNPQKTMVAIMYGNNSDMDVNLHRQIDLVAFEDPNFFVQGSKKSRDNFSDVIIK